MHNVYRCRAGVQLVQYRNTCLFRKSSVKTCMASKRRAPNDLPGPAPRAQAPGLLHEIVVIDRAAVVLSRRESKLLRSSGKIPKFDFSSMSKVK